MVGTLLFLLAPSVVFAATSIAWRDQVTVSAPNLFLTDIADLAGDDPARVAMLRDISMGEAPLPGQNRYLTREILQARLVGQGVNYLAEGWQIPAGITVTTASQTITMDAIKAVVRSELLAKTAYPQSDVTVKFRGDIQDPTVELGQYTIIPKFPTGIRYNRPTTAVAEIWVDQRHSRDVFLTCDVNALTDVYILNKPVGNSQFLSIDDVSIEKRSVGRLPLRAVKNDQIFKTYWTRRTLAPGTILTEDMFDLPPVVKRQNQVVISIDFNGIKLQTLGFALQDGRSGDVIRVQNAETKRIIMARVTEKGSVTPLGF